MMKKLWLFGIFILSIASGIAADPAQFLPAHGACAVYADGLRIANEIASQKTPDTPTGLTRFQEVLQKNSVTLPELFSGAVFAVFSPDGTDSGLLFSSAVSAGKLQKIVLDFLELTGRKFKSESVLSGKYTITWFQCADMPQDATNGGEVLCIAYLADDVVYVNLMEKSSIAQAGEKFAQFGNSPLAEKLDRKQLVSLFCDVAQWEANLADNQKSGIRDWALNVNLAGVNQKDIELASCVHPLAEKQLQKLGAELHESISADLSTTFQNVPDIAGELCKNLSVTMQGNALYLALKIPEALCAKIKSFCVNSANFAKPANYAKPAVRNDAPQESQIMREKRAAARALTRDSRKFRSRRWRPVRLIRGWHPAVWTRWIERERPERPYDPEEWDEPEIPDIPDVPDVPDVPDMPDVSSWE